MGAPPGRAFRDLPASCDNRAMTDTLKASCLCRGVAWEVDAPLRPLDGPYAPLTFSHCHCTRCRKTHGAAFSTYLVVREQEFRLTRGREHIVTWQSPGAGTRPFCGVCGSVVPDGVASHGVIGMPAGPFDDDIPLRPMAHIFVASKAPWVTLHDDLPRFDAYPDALGAPALPTRAPVDPWEGHPRGSCLCGEVAYVVEGPLLRARNCHCSRCRKAVSAAFFSALITTIDGVRFTRGEERVRGFKVPDAQFFEHRFCGTCGSAAPRRSAPRGITVIPMGTLDDDPGMRPGSHIFAASRASWDVITDDLPRHDEYPPA